MTDESPTQVYHCEHCGFTSETKRGVRIHTGKEHSQRCWYHDDKECDKIAKTMMRVRWPYQEGKISEEWYCDDHAVSAAIEIVCDSVTELLTVERDGEKVPMGECKPDSWEKDD